MSTVHKDTGLGRAAPASDASDSGRAADRNTNAGATPAPTLPRSRTVPKYADEAAFPQPHQMRLDNEQRQKVLLPAQWGLTKRELFAAMALQGMLANPDWISEHTDYAIEAVTQADELLTALSESQR